MWTGENDTKTTSVDANLFENGAKQLPAFSFENELVWTGPKSNIWFYYDIHHATSLFFKGEFRNTDNL